MKKRKRAVEMEGYGKRGKRVYKDLCKRSLHLKEENVWKSKKKFWTN
jgi:hypothetical protein